MTEPRNSPSAGSSEVRALCEVHRAPVSFPWPDYLREYRIEGRHSAELLGIVSKAAASPGLADASIVIHAGRALAQLGCLDVIEPLLRVTEDSADVAENVPAIAAVMGASAIDSLEQVIGWPPDKGTTPAVVAIEGLALIAKWHANAAEPIGRLLCRRLEGYANQSRYVNGALLAAIEFAAVKECESLTQVVRRQSLYYRPHRMAPYPQTVKDVFVEARPRD